MSRPSAVELVLAYAAPISELRAELRFESVIETADAMLRTLAEIRALPEREA